MKELEQMTTEELLREYLIPILQTKRSEKEWKIIEAENERKYGKRKKEE